MKIVVTDGYTLNPGDLSWDPIASFGDLVLYDRTPAHLVTERCRDAAIVLTNKVAFPATVLQELPQLKLISVTATGYNVIDVKAARAQQIVVCNVPAYGTASVAQHTIALLLELTNQVGVHAASVASGEWVNATDWCYSKTPITELAGKTMGIVGWGHIGQQTARIAQAFDMNLVYYTPTKKENAFAVYRTLPELFTQSDVVSLHCPLTANNAGFVNNDLLQLMKPTAFLINTGRGQLIHEQHLADALNHGRIAGAALDVLSTEPPAANNPLLSAKHCIITPHNAWISKEARQRIMNISANNIRAFLQQQPVHVVN
jgi:glycerate dehydrogenase